MLGMLSPNIVHLAIFKTIGFIPRKRLHQFDVTEEQLREADVRYFLNFGLRLIVSVFLLLRLNVCISL